jgi:hypothetical protein
MAGRRMARPVNPQLRNYPCVPALTLRANARSRCAPARCAGARAERPVADGEDSDSGVASINSRIVGVQRMIKNSRIICGQHPFTANHIDPAITQIQKIGLTNSANQFA